MNQAYSVLLNKYYKDMARKINRLTFRANSVVPKLRITKIRTNKN